MRFFIDRTPRHVRVVTSDFASCIGALSAAQKPAVPAVACDVGGATHHKDLKSRSLLTRLLPLQLKAQQNAAKAIITT